MLAAELVTDVEALDALAPQWDALAADCALPQMSPAWVLAWWRHVAPDGAQPRTVVVRDGAELVGVAPYYVETGGGGRVDYRLPGIEIAARLAPLARRDREWDVAEAIGATLARATPRPDALLFEGVPVESHWLTALRERWPGALRPPLRSTSFDGNPVATLAGDSFEQWLAARSSNFRGQMRRLRRRFADAGGSSRLATRATLAADAATLTRLHAMRWDGRGHSNLVDLGDRFSAMVVELGERLLDERRFALRVLELDGEPVAAQLFVGAGGTVLFVNGGWDERHAALKPSLLCLLDAVEDGFAAGADRLDLGVGEQSYKLRFADGSLPLAWAVLLLPTPRLPLTAARTAPALAQARLRDGAQRMLSEQHVERLRAARQRLRSGR
ncbi:MAG TPA: GNAT family N-acetyltransferase [Conexibacter sp.]|nr:GNAT family N-acetyltransferase [Conexibacter sp.]